jgi:transcriptional regulator with XRE-family HTH domain
MGNKMLNVLNQVDNEKTSVGQMTRAFRKARGFTLKKVEELTGISMTHLSSIENDKIELGIKRAELLAAAFGVRPQDILFPNGQWEKTKLHEQIEEKANKLAMIG